MHASESPAPRLRSLDRLRGVAILAVLLHHLLIFTPMEDVPGAIYRSLAEFGAHGVDLFFVLSGFLLVHALPSAGPAKGWLAGFWLRRAAKILPLYALVLLGSHLLIMGVLAGAGPQERVASLGSLLPEWPWHAGFATNWLIFRDGAFNNPLLNVAWSLGVEVQFYALLSLAFFFGVGRSARFWWGVAILALASRILATELDWNWVRVLAFTPGRLDTFALGALAALTPSVFSGPLRWVAWTVLVIPLCLPWSRESGWVEIAGYSWVALASAAAITQALRSEARNPIPSPDRSALAFLGRISYSIYLTHVPVRIAVRDGLFSGDRTLDNPTAWAMHLVYVLLAGGISILLGWAVWRWIERPAQVFILNKYARTAHPVATPAP